MSAVIWVNILLTLPFLVAFIGIPLWLTFHRPETAPDHAEARAYLRARAALTRRATPTPAPPQPAHDQADRVIAAA